jgi:hypothetical protein
MGEEGLIKKRKKNLEYIQSRKELSFCKSTSQISKRKQNSRQKKWR